MAALAFVDAALHFSGHVVHVASPLRKRRKQEAASAAPISPPSRTQGENLTFIDRNPPV
ncbi:hypothetical protein [Paracoccus jeotgali]|uniref:hypothetical protein n=1 Tax=Paracoccus jeotgali TaxID=2065379 RepID=UPI0028A8BCF8|nr:hypothetical protein [Paracoccus jeotgali]